MYCELELVMINYESVYACVENFDKIGVIICIRLRVIIHEVIPMALFNPIHNYMPYALTSFNILKKSFSVKMEGAMNLILKNM